MTRAVRVLRLSRLLGKWSSPVLALGMVGMGRTGGSDPRPLPFSPGEASGWRRSPRRRTRHSCVGDRHLSADPLHLLRDRRRMGVREVTIMCSPRPYTSYEGVMIAKTLCRHSFDVFCQAARQLAVREREGGEVA